MMRLTRLMIHRYRGVEPGTELHFSRGINVLLGKNGTGKTTLLNLIAMIARSDFSPLKNEDFHFAFTMEIGTLKVEMQLEGHPPPDLDGRTEHKSNVSFTFPWKYRLSTAEGPDTAMLEVEDGKISREFPPSGLGASGQTFFDLYTSRLFRRLTFLSQFVPHSDSVLGQLSRAEKNHPGFPTSDAGRFDEGLSVFRSIIGDSSSLDASGLPDATSIRVGEQDADKHWWTSKSTPLELSSLLARHWQRSRSGETPSFTELEVTTKIALALELKAVSVRPVFIEGDPKEAMYKGVSFTIALDSFTTVTHDALSFGQKRRLAFLWYLASNPQGIVIADELVNGFHYEWIADSIDDIGDRQAFIASQNPLLLDFLTFDSAEEVRDAFVFCSAEPRPDGKRGWTWKNMSEDEAGSFFRAHQVGIQHVSDILRTKGLW